MVLKSVPGGAPMTRANRRLSTSSFSTSSVNITESLELHRRLIDQLSEKVVALEQLSEKVVALERNNSLLEEQVHSLTATVRQQQQVIESYDEATKASSQEILLDQEQMNDKPVSSSSGSDPAVTTPLQSVKRSKRRRKRRSTSGNETSNESNSLVPELLSGLSSLLTAVSKNNSRNIRENSPSMQRGKRKILYLTNAHHETNEAQIMRYVKDEFNVQDVSCNAVVPWNRRRSELEFVNFKITVPESSVHDMLNQTRWPREVRIREWSIGSQRSPSSEDFRRNRYRSQIS